LNIGIVGCGSIAPKHLKAIKDNREEIQLKALCDTNPEQMQKTIDSYMEGCSNDQEDIKIFDDYKDLLKDEDIDIVAIATSSGIRPHMAKEALKANKNLILEKPLALSIRDADDIISLSENKGLKVAVCHQLRFMPHMAELKHAIDSGAFGKLFHATVHMRWNRNDDYYKAAPWRGTWEHDGGALMNQAIHAIDLLLWMMGPVERVYAEVDTLHRPIEAEDTAMAVVKFKNGALGIIEGSVCVYPQNLEETFNIFGENGTVCIGGKALNEIKAWDIKGRAPFEITGTVSNFHTLLYKDMIDAIKDNRAPLVDAREAKKAVELILATYKSSKNIKPITLPIKDFATSDMREGCN
jgi:UDP-N-acetyl-2-amino-2-deoxyglucuronate dehydrogenase